MANKLSSFEAWISTDAKFIADSIFRELGLVFSSAEIINFVVSKEESFFKKLLQLPLQRCYTAMIFEQSNDIMYDTRQILTEITTIHEKIKFQQLTETEDSTATFTAAYAKELTQLNNETEKATTELATLLSDYNNITLAIFEHNKMLVAEWTSLANKTPEDIQRLLMRVIDPELRDKLNEIRNKITQLHRKLKTNMLYVTKIVQQEALYAQSKPIAEAEILSEHIVELPKLGQK